MKCTNGIKKLGLPENFKFGIEIEADNVQTKGESSLYTGEALEFIKNKKWHVASAHEERLVKEGGAELVSPILKDSENTWKNLEEICNLIKKYPGKKGNEVIANEKCGLHIHFDADCIASDPSKMKQFLKIYAESEELIYKMCNDKNDSIRKYAINRDFSTLIKSVSSIWRVGIAAPSGKKILEKIENGTLKVSYKKLGKFRNLTNKLKIDERRYYGLNLTNIGSKNKNTIEFRMANGTLNSETIKQNVFLYSSIINAAIKSVEQPELYQKKLNNFYKTDVTEEEKVNNFLNLIMNNEEDRRIYYERWESVKDAKIFQKNSKKNFAQNRFNRDEFRRNAENVPKKNIEKALSTIKNIMNKEKTQGEAIDER